MFLRILPYPALVAIIFFTSACSSENVPKPTEAEVITENIFGQSGHFRGNEIGDSMEEVLKNDRGYLFKRRQDELNYSIPLSFSDSAYYDVAYVFDKDVLFEIQVDLLLNSDKKVAQLFEAISQRLSKRYGDPSLKPEYAFWEATEDRRALEITLRDVSREYNRPFLSLNIIEPQRFNP